MLPEEFEIALDGRVPKLEEIIKVQSCQYASSVIQQAPVCNLSGTHEAVSCSYNDFGMQRK